MTIQSVSEYLIENAASLAEEVLNFNLKKLEFEVPKALIEKGREIQTKFIQFLAETMTYDSEEKVAKEFNEWNRENRQQDTSMYDRISSIVKPYPESRLFFNQMISSICLEKGLTVENATFVQNRLNFIQDLSLAESILMFEKYKDEINQQTRKQMMELSAPIVSLKNGVAILPLIGSIDYNRAEHFSNKVIPKINQLGIHSLIIDFSGIVSVNPEVASYLFNINNVLILLGINVAVTGMRPDLANSIVNQGISFKKIKTYLNVKQALDAWENAEGE